MPCSLRWEGHTLPISGTTKYSFCVLGFCLGEMANVGPDTRAAVKSDLPEFGVYFCQAEALWT